MVLRAIIIGVVDALDARPAVQIFLDLRATALVGGGGVLVEQHAAIAFRHRAIGGIHLAGGEIVKPRAAQIIGPGLFGRMHVAPEAVQIDQPRAKGRQASCQFRTTGRAQRHGGVGVGKPRAAVQQPVKVGGLDRDAKGVAPCEHVDHVIDPDHADIVLRDGFGGKSHHAPSVRVSRAGSAQRCKPPCPHASRNAPALAG